MDFEDGFFTLIIAVIVGLLIWFVINTYYRLAEIPTKDICHIVDSYIDPDTQEFNVVPVITTKGVGMGVFHFGHPMAPIIIWQCDKFGRIVTENKDLYRIAKPTMELGICQVNKISICSF